MFIMKGELLVTFFLIIFPFGYFPFFVLLLAEINSSTVLFKDDNWSVIVLILVCLSFVFGLCVDVEVLDRSNTAGVLLFVIIFLTLLTFLLLMGLWFGEVITNDESRSIVGIVAVEDEEEEEVESRKDVECRVVIIGGEVGLTSTDLNLLGGASFVSLLCSVVDSSLVRLEVEFVGMDFICRIC